PSPISTLAPPPASCPRRARILAPPMDFLFLSTAPATPAIYTLSLHDALPISAAEPGKAPDRGQTGAGMIRIVIADDQAMTMRIIDRKSTRLNSSHVSISYAVFCLKKKNSWTSTQGRASRRRTCETDRRQAPGT